jgi:hypothetical protein
VRRERVYKWARSMSVFAAIAATGAGLHVAASVIEDKAHIEPLAAVLALTIPVAIYLLGIYWLYSVLYAERHWFHLLPQALTVAVLVLAPVLAHAGADLPLGRHDRSGRSVSSAMKRMGTDTSQKRSSERWCRDRMDVLVRWSAQRLIPVCY